MKTSVRRPTVNKPKDEKHKEDVAARSKDDKSRKPINEISTPRNIVQKSTTADIYAKSKSKSIQNAPRKSNTTLQTSKNSPMKDLLKSSPVNMGQISSRSSVPAINKTSSKVVSSRSISSTPRSGKSLPFSSVTVNSPMVKKKLPLEMSRTKIATTSSQSSKKTETNYKTESERQRSKTRELSEEEVRVLRKEGDNNNAQMNKLRLKAQPKAFYIDLEDEKIKKPIEKSSDDDVSYEDDFESYESDFESYHSDQQNSEPNSDLSDDVSKDEEEKVSSEIKENEQRKETIKDEERMLDSGSFDLRDLQRSANKSKPPTMEFILEDSEVDRKERTSMTDEGFQDMSSSSGVSSMKHVDVLDRPLFINFTKSKENKRKRLIHESLKQRANDILNMITLHEMSYNLFEMKPIPYDLFMSTFGKSNYKQTSVQTFDDGISEESQTDDVSITNKWTQYPIEFSNNRILLSDEVSKTNVNKRKDSLVNFSFLKDLVADKNIVNDITDKDYMNNPLRIYLEQKDGIGSTNVLPYETYKNKLKVVDFNVVRLSKFLKRSERKINCILCSTEYSNKDVDIKKSKIPFSKGYTTICLNNIDEELKFLKGSRISRIVFSNTKSNILMTVHSDIINKYFENNNLVCMWDTHFLHQPVKILVSVNNISIARLKGDSDGVFIAALDDGSINLWDLSERPSWFPHNHKENDKLKDIVDVKSTNLTQTEIDRHWNLINNYSLGDAKDLPKKAFQACSYTTSAINSISGEGSNVLKGLELYGIDKVINQEGGRRVLGQVASLTSMGIITLWIIAQEKLETPNSDSGKAYWAKMKLEKTQTIQIMNYIDIPRTDLQTEEKSCFNLNSAKRRISYRKQNRKNVKKEISRLKSAKSFDIDRPSSAASNKELPATKYNLDNWEYGVDFNYLKVINYDRCNYFLVAKSCGQVLMCTKSIGTIKLNFLQVTAEASTVTCLEVLRAGLPYFLAATDSGTVNLCSVLDDRVLLTLDCRNGPAPESIADKCLSDHKGRFLGSAAVRTPVDNSTDILSKMSISSIAWSAANPCCIFALKHDGALVTWQLTKSDINAACVIEKASKELALTDNILALLPTDDGVQLHILPNEESKRNMNIFEKYVALL